MPRRASLNHVFRTIWNPTLGVMVAVAEICSSGARCGGTRRTGRIRLDVAGAPMLRRLALSLGIAMAWGATPALANPGGAVAVVGQATLVNQGNKLTVTTQNGAAGNYSAINWQSFSIPAGSTTYFQQPSAASTSINRVVTNTPSLLFGTLGSNGNLVLVNQSGITVGAGAVVDTAGFTASSLRMSDADALAGRLRFGDGTASSAAVSVQGSVLARSGDVVLMGGSVDTGRDALIQAPNGSTILAAGRQIELTGRGLEGISLQVQAPTDSALNLGTLQGDAVGIFAGTLRHSGAIQAASATLDGGKVVLKAATDAYVEGTGRIEATGTAGGTVDVLGNRVAVTDQAVIDASGAQGGGTVRIGGDYQGRNPDIQNANITYFGPQAVIKADATGNGNGGKVIVWADDTTRALGSITARGGEQGGNGGFVETSGKLGLLVDGAVVSTAAPKGKMGEWLLDPIAINIVNAGTGTLSGGIFDPSVSTDISPATITGYGGLVTSNVTIQTATGGGGTITVTDPVNWTSGTTLSLLAGGGIAINGAISNTPGTGPAGTLVLNTATGDIVQTAAIAVPSLSAVAQAGSVTLNALNSVNLIAGYAGGGSGFSFTNNGSLQVGTLGAQYGVSSNALPITLSAGSIDIVDATNGVNAGAADATLTATSGTVDESTLLGVIKANTLNVSAAKSVSLNSSGNVVNFLNASQTISAIGYGGGISFTNNGPLSIVSISHADTGGSPIAINATADITVAGPVTAGSTTTQVSISSDGAILGSGLITANIVLLQDGTNGPVGSAGGPLQTSSIGGSGNASITIGNSDWGPSAVYLNHTGDATLSVIRTDSDPTATKATPVDIAATGNLSLAATRGIGTGAADLKLSAGNLLSIPSSAGLTAENIFLTADLMNLGAVGAPASISASGDVWLQTYTAGRSIDLGAKAGLTNGLELSSGEVSSITARTFHIGSSTAGGVNVSAPIASGSVGVLSLESGAQPITANSSISNSGYGGGVFLKSAGAVDLKSMISTTSGDINVVAGTTFTNGYGGAVLQPGTGSRWLVYAPDPASVTKNGLTPTLYQYNTAYGDKLATGSGFVYASSVSVNAGFAGTLSSSYGAAPTASAGYSLSGLDGDDSTTAATITGSASYSNWPISALSPAGTYSLQYAGGLTSSVPYALNLAVGTSQTYTVNPALLLVTANNAAKNYDGIAYIGGNGVSYSGLVNNEGANVLSGVLSYGGTSQGAINAGSYAITPGGLSSGNYTISYGDGTLTVNPALAGISLNGIRTYDGTNVVNASIFSLTGLVGTETLTLTGSGTLADKNIGVDKPVSLGSLALGNGSGLAANYTFTGGTQVATVMPATITGVSGIVASNKVYDGTTTASLNTTSVVLAGAIGGDSLNVTGATGTFSDKNVGLAKTVSIAGIGLGGTDALNYTLNTTTASTTADISRAPITAVTGIGASNKVYDGTTTASLNTTSAVLVGAISGDNLGVTGAAGAFVDKNAGLGKAVAITGIALAGTDAGNYNLTTTTSGTVADIARASLTGVAGIAASDKVYDGSTTATVSTAAAVFGGLISGDAVNVGSVKADFVDKNVGVGKTVNLTNLTLSGPDAGNYNVPATITPIQGTITVRPLSTWTAAGSGQWSNSGNWDALPDGTNVLAVSIPAGVSVVYDGAVGATNLQSVTSAGTLALAGGSLSVAGSLSTAQYSQSGGALSGAGSLSVTGAFTQTAGTIALGGPVAITQGAGNLSVGSIQAASISLAAPTGGITQSAGLVSTGLLATQSATGTLLNDAGNRIGSFRATNTGVGNIEFTNVGVLDVQGISAANGDITLVDTGGISTSGLVQANAGAVTMTANSPLTIGSSGISANNNITLTATNLTSSGNMTLNGPLTSFAGGITLDAANNFVQNSSLTAALAINVSAGGSMTFGPFAMSTGNPVNYYINGQPLAPPWLAAALGAATSDFVVSFLSEFQDSLEFLLLDYTDPLAQYRQNKSNIVVEGNICSR
jgi:filamentous hemagglutinin family protein